MKNIKEIIGGILFSLLCIFAGYMLRQPQVNKLKRELRVSVDDNGRLKRLYVSTRKLYEELLLQVKAQRALRLMPKELKDNLTANIVLQYSIFDYVTILIKYIREEKKLDKNELLFLDAFENVVNGDTLSTKDKTIIKNYTLKRHKSQINKKLPCNCDSLMLELKSAVS